MGLRNETHRSDKQMRSTSESDLPNEMSKFSSTWFYLVYTVGSVLLGFTGLYWAILGFTQLYSGMKLMIQ